MPLAAIETFHWVLELDSHGNVSQLGICWHLGQDIYHFMVPSCALQDL